MSRKSLAFPPGPVTVTVTRIVLPAFEPVVNVTVVGLPVTAPVDGVTVAVVPKPDSFCTVMEKVTALVLLKLNG